MEQQAQESSTEQVQAEDTENLLVIKPTGVPDTVSVRVWRDGALDECAHVTRGQFEQGNAPEILERRFDLWENVDREETRMIPLPGPSHTLLCSTAGGTGEVQTVRNLETGETVVRVVFRDGARQKYRVRKETQTVTVPVDAPPERDGEAKLLLLHYLAGAKNVAEIRFDDERRNKRLRREAHPGTETLEAEARRAVLEGYVLDEDGNPVEPDAKGSPLRKAGLI